VNKELVAELIDMTLASDAGQGNFIVRDDDDNPLAALFFVPAGDDAGELITALEKTIERFHDSDH